MTQAFLGWGQYNLVTFTHRLLRSADFLYDQLGWLARFTADIFVILLGITVSYSYLLNCVDFGFSFNFNLFLTEPAFDTVSFCSIQVTVLVWVRVRVRSGVFFSFCDSLISSFKKQIMKVC